MSARALALVAFALAMTGCAGRDVLGHPMTPMHYVCPVCAWAPPPADPCAGPWLTRPIGATCPEK